MPITKLYDGGIIATYDCQAACAHCLYGCAPGVTPGYIASPMTAHICEHLLRLGCRTVHIGGGEPFLDAAGLICLAKTLVERGMQISFIETNAAWISGDDARDEDVLRSVADAGGCAIMVSADPFHVEYIPFWKTQRLILLLERLGIRYFVWQDGYIPWLMRLDPQKTYDAAALQRTLGFDAQAKCAADYGLTWGGRALALSRKLGREHSRDFDSPCRQLRGTSHFHVDLFGMYIPPGCPGMGIKIEDIDKPADAQKYPVMTRLRDGGVGALTAYARQMGFTMPPDDVSRCELCFLCRKFLVENHADAHLDLLPVGFYGVLG